MDKVMMANKYINDNLNIVDRKYQPTYHAVSPIGWVNDPNGFSYYNDKIHLFFQFYPYKPNWGPMHWGHYTSTDFIKWELKPVALAPGEVYDKDLGAFSGSAVVKDGKHYLFYTGVADDLQQQCAAISEDGINYVKVDTNPVVSKEMLPDKYSKIDFRDPYVFLHDGIYYMILGTKKASFGNIVMFKSLDLLNWEFVGEVMNSDNPNNVNFYQLDGVYECPSFAYVDGVGILISSPQNLPTDKSNFENISSNIYMVGDFDFTSGKFTYDKFMDLDGGFDFYAAQTTKMPDGRVILIAWMQMWGREFVTSEYNWVGAFTLPRELSYRNGHLYQNPVKEIYNYRTGKVSYNNINIKENESLKLDNISGNTIELELTIKVNDSLKTGVKLFKGTTSETLVYYDKESSTVIIDRSKSGIVIKGEEENISTRSTDINLIDGCFKLHIFLDISSVEVFINDGYKTLTANVYPKDDDLGIEFFSIGGSSIIKEIDKYSIIIK
jgi:beta-fructofuranosidase